VSVQVNSKADPVKRGESGDEARGKSFLTAVGRGRGTVSLLPRERLGESIRESWQGICGLCEWCG